MRRLFILTILSAVIAVTTPAGAVTAIVRHSSGEVIEGELLWNGRALSPIDRLHSYRGAEGDSREPFRLSLFGVRLLGPERPAPRSMTLPWGLLAEIEPADDQRTRVVTRGGLELHVTGGDLDPESRLTVVVTADERRHLSFGEVESIQLSTGDSKQRLSDRLYGDVDWEGGAMSGWIEWDRDERLWGDLLDGDDGSGARQSIAFGEIRKIERVGMEASDVTLQDGSVWRLAGTNDVAQGHRGLIVESESTRVELPWQLVRSVELRRSPIDVVVAGSPEKPLRALICARDGRTLHGVIEWDLDERYQFETLEGGVARAIEYRIRFDVIAEVASIDGRGSYVRLRDGGELSLFDRVDVASDHRGIRIDGDQMLSWYESERVFFANSAQELAELVQRAPCGDR